MLYIFGFYHPTLSNEKILIQINIFLLGLILITNPYPLTFWSMLIPLIIPLIKN